jgi:hypothetical protein
MPELARTAAENEPDDLADFIKNRKAQAPDAKGRHPLPEPEQSNTEPESVIFSLGFPPSNLQTLVAGLRARG